MVCVGVLVGRCYCCIKVLFDCDALLSGIFILISLLADRPIPRIFNRCIYTYADKCTQTHSHSQYN